MVTTSRTWLPLQLLSPFCSRSHQRDTITIFLIEGTSPDGVVSRFPDEEKIERKGSGEEALDSSRVLIERLATLEDVI